MKKWEQKVMKAFPAAKDFYCTEKADHSKVPSVYGELHFQAGQYVSFDDLSRLSQMFGTRNINMGAEYTEGCSTCGGTRSQQIVVKNITIRND